MPPIDSPAMPSVGALWSPDPLRLPMWRTRLRNYFLQKEVHGLISYKTAGWKERHIPIVPGRTGALVSARLLCEEEAGRLDDARLYFADEDMTVLAAAVGAKRPQELVSVDRLPSPAGFMVFATPLGTHRVTAQEMQGIVPLPDESPVLHVPTVAVSWSIWSPTNRDSDPIVNWVYRSGRERYENLPEKRGIWLTFYSTRSLGFEYLAPETRLGTEIHTGQITTAGEQVRLSKKHAPLNRIDTVYLPFDEPFPEAPPDSPYLWTQAVYTAWQLVQQEGRNGWTETETVSVPLKRPSGKRRAPQHEKVCLIRLRPNRRPSPEATARDRAEADAENPTRYTHRYPVPPYRRPNACWNTAIHGPDPETRRCRHAEQIVAGSIRGPKHLPLRVPSVFTLTPPSESTAAAQL